VERGTGRGGGHDGVRQAGEVIGQAVVVGFIGGDGRGVVDVVQLVVFARLLGRGVDDGEGEGRVGEDVLGAGSAAGFVRGGVLVEVEDVEALAGDVGEDEIGGGEVHAGLEDGQAGDERAGGVEGVDTGRVREDWMAWEADRLQAVPLGAAPEFDLAIEVRAGDDKCPEESLFGC